MDEYQYMVMKARTWLARQVPRLLAELAATRADLKAALDRERHDAERDRDYIPTRPLTPALDAYRLSRGEPLDTEWGPAIEWRPLR